MRQLLDDAVTRGLCSAAALSVGDGGREVLREVVGTTRTGGPAIDERAWFDLASLTKPMATAAIAARADFDLARRAPGAPAGTTWIHLLGHAAGFPAHRKYFERMQGRDEIIAAARAEPLEYQPGTKTIYSDCGYLTLGAALEEELGGNLSELHARSGLEGPRFGPITEGTVVETELGTPPGQVHDENARAAGGICGHAGLFGTIDHVATFAREWLAEVKTNPRARAMAETSAAPDTSWRLGWDTPSRTPGVSHAGDLWPREHAIGHLGFTGTSLWLDLSRARWVALLTNRVHPSREGPRAAAIKDLRRAVMDAAVGMLG